MTVLRTSAAFWIYRLDAAVMLREVHERLVELLTECRLTPPAS